MVRTLGAASLLKLDELASSASDPVAVSYLRTLIEDGQDIDCYKVNAFRVANEIGVSRPATLRALLFATRLGLFDLNWDVRCPSCTGTPDFHRHLMQLNRSAHCGLCDLDWQIEFDEQVEVTFTVNPDVRKLDIRDFRDRNFSDKLAYFNTINMREQRLPHARVMCGPNTNGTLDVALLPGQYRYEVPGHPEVGGKIFVSGGPPVHGQKASLVVSVDGSIDVRTLTFAPGTATLSIAYGYPRHWPLLVQRIEAPMNWVSAAYVTSQQDFRDLFSGEFLAPGVSFAMRSITLMFTDIRGSTEMYETLGDGAAYALVQEHFKLMSDEIRLHEGGIVKTIGDAVMAAFPLNADAVRAALAIQTAFKAHVGRLKGIEVKIGLHRGPTIAVTSNRALDYFGRTVNVAARVQGESRPRQILLSDTVLADPAVRAILEERGMAISHLEARLKGVAKPMALASIAP